jgi:hypothetical protein
MKGSEIDRELAEITENLHRIDLTGQVHHRLNGRDPA